MERLVGRITEAAGSIPAIVVAVALVIVWAAAGPLLGYSDTWQLTINTGTTIITFIMVFVVQTTQNRDGRAVQTKLDMLLRADEEMLSEIESEVDPRLLAEMRRTIGLEDRPDREIRHEQAQIRDQ